MEEGIRQREFFLGGGEVAQRLEMERLEMAQRWEMASRKMVWQN
jgi:hypothetical protein